MSKWLPLAFFVACASMAQAQTTVSDDWSTPPSGDDGRDGWRHNLIFESEWSRPPQGDVGTRVQWLDDAGNGVLRGIERAAGAEDRFVAPSKFYAPNGGNFAGMTSCVLSFRIKTVAPATPPTAANRLGVNVALASGGYLSTITLQPNSGLPAAFYDTLGVWYDVSVNLLDPTGWVVTQINSEDPPIDHATLLAAVDGLLTDIDIISGAETHYIDDVTLTYDAGAGTQTVVSDFNAGPSTFDSARAGWTRNHTTDGFAPAPQGDTLTFVELVGDGLGVFEAGSGSNDYYVAPSRYLVNGGKWNGLASGVFQFDFTRKWPEVVTVANRGSHVVRLYNGTAFVQFTTEVAAFPADYFDVSNITHTIITPDLMTSGTWTTSPATRPAMDILKNVTAILIDGEVVSGREVNVMDNFSFTYTMRKMVSGNISFSDFVGTVPVDTLVEYRDQSTSAVLDSNIASIATDGSYVSYLPVAMGAFNMAIKPSGFLRKVVAITASGVDLTDVNFTLINGDVDNDNEIGPGDFGSLSAAFGSVSGDANWLAAADLDGDGEVGPSDFGILSANFGLSGDE